MKDFTITVKVPSIYLMNSGMEGILLKQRTTIEKKNYRCWKKASQGHPNPCVTACLSYGAKNLLVLGEGEYFFKVPHGGIKRLGEPNGFADFQIEALPDQKRKRLATGKSMPTSSFDTWEGMDEAVNDGDDDGDFEDDRDIDEPSDE